MIRTEQDRAASLPRLRHVLTALAVLATLVVGASGPATASTPPFEPPIDFEITGFRCEVEVTRDVTRPDGTRIVQLIESGQTSATIGVMTGTLTVRSTAVVGPDGTGRINGRWTMEPAASSGAIRGTFRGTVTGQNTAEIHSVGNGIQALRGISIETRTTTGTSTEGSPCESELAFAGAGSARYRDYPAPTGAVVTISTQSFDETLAAVTAAIEGNQRLRLIATIDHRRAAASRDITLGPTTELIFGNPAIGTPLMQEQQSIGIDLPQKILVWQDPLGIVRVAYNAPSYLVSRHELLGGGPQLETVAGALAGLAGVATGTTLEPVFDAGSVPGAAGLVTVTSDRSVDEAADAIVAALDAAPPVNVAAVIDHRANATSIGAELRPTKLIIFGNPSLGSGLMRNDQSIAIDLPQKILVYEDVSGQTVIAYNNPYYVARRHDVGGEGPTLERLAGALANFASKGQ